MILDFVKGGPILLVGCHPDDVEIGCGGLMSKLKGKVEIYVITLSKFQKIRQEKKWIKVNKNLISESKKSLKVLGINQKNVIYGDFITREFSYQRQEIADFLWKIGHKINPTCVFIIPYDLHQDHQVGHEECLRVFRERTIIEYDVPRSEKSLKPRMFVELSEKNLNDKLHAMSQYKTWEEKNYLKKDVLIAECKANGVKFNLPLSEAFNPISIIL